MQVEWGDGGWEPEGGLRVATIRTYTTAVGVQQMTPTVTVHRIGHAR